MSGFPWLGLGGSRWAATAALAVHTLPLLLITAALTPALILCPFLGAPHRRWLLNLLALMRDWAATPGGTATRGAADKPGRSPDEQECRASGLPCRCGRVRQT
jgi:hypothetical protein